MKRPSKTHNKKQTNLATNKFNKQIKAIHYTQYIYIPIYIYISMCIYNKTNESNKQTNSQTKARATNARLSKTNKQTNNKQN
jgi:hypothetical protein